MGSKNWIDFKNIEESFENFSDQKPFPHCIVDNFLNEDLFNKLEEEFLPFDSPRWFVYDNVVEKKKALNDWNAFPPATYQFFQSMLAEGFVEKLSKLVGTKLYPDPGLHGGGWHIHGPGGNLNPHLDYVIHPKLGLQRKINLIIYVQRDLMDEHGGHLGLWEHNPLENSPGKLFREIQPKRNRAVFFDASMNSWHGLSRPLVEKAGVFRKSYAIYYLCRPALTTENRGRALFAPRNTQIKSKELDSLISLRANLEESGKVYRQLPPIGPNLGD